MVGIERYLLGQNTACKFSGLSPLSSDETTLIQKLNGEKIKCRTKTLTAFSSVVFLTSTWKNVTQKFAYCVLT